MTDNNNDNNNDDNNNQQTTECIANPETKKETKKDNEPFSALLLDVSEAEITKTVGNGYCGYECFAHFVGRPMTGEQNVFDLIKEL